MYLKNKAHYETKKEAIHFLFTGIRDEIYSTVDACKTAHDMWITIKRLQQGESLNIQDVKTNLFWEFGKFTSHDGESMKYKNDNHSRQFRNQRTVTVVGARETIGSQVPTADLGTDTEPLEEVQYDAEYNMFANERQHFEQPESISNTCVVEKVDSNVIPNSSSMCDNDIQTDQNAKECDDEHAVLANLIANLKLYVDENKKIQKQLKKANASLAHELKECKSILMETSKTLRKSNSTRCSCLVSLQNKQTELETYKTLNDRTVDYDK
nr:hypothetical protein [Tanacetum cinerariifolium]